MSKSKAARLIEIGFEYDSIFCEHQNVFDTFEAAYLTCLGVVPELVLTGINSNDAGWPGVIFHVGEDRDPNNCACTIIQVEDKFYASIWLDNLCCGVFDSFDAALRDIVASGDFEPAIPYEILREGSVYHVWVYNRAANEGVHIGSIDVEGGIFRVYPA